MSNQEAFSINIQGHRHRRTQTTFPHVAYLSSRSLSYVEVLNSHFRFKKASVLEIRASHHRSQAKRSGIRHLALDRTQLYCKERPLSS